MEVVEHKSLKIGRCLGRGAEGAVYEGRWQVRGWGFPFSLLGHLNRKLVSSIRNISAGSRPRRGCCGSTTRQQRRLHLSSNLLLLLLNDSKNTSH